MDVPRFENEFSVDVDIYCLSPDHSVIPRYMSKSKHGDKMVLNLTPDGTHLSYVKKVDTFLTRFKCDQCSRHFDHMSHLTRHSKVCKKKQAIYFPGGSYKLPLNMHEKLVRVGIEVPDGKRIAYKWFATFDCESILDTNIADKTTDDKTEYLNRHIPVSMSLASNVPGFTDPVFLCERNPDVLVDTFLKSLREIKDKAANLARNTWADVFKDLDAKIKTSGNTDIERQGQFVSLKKEFTKYCDRLVVFGFNSQKYDLNLLKPYLFRHLNDDDSDDDEVMLGNNDDNDDNVMVLDVDNDDVMMMDGDDKDNDKDDDDKLIVIKRNSAYMSIMTSEFKFLDACNYLAPATSLNKFYTAFGVDSGKLFFPYEKVTSFDVLMEPCEFPDYGDFYSKLRSCNVLESDAKALTPQHRRDVGQQNYDMMKKLWDDHHMSCLRDLLEVYNNADVSPLIQAIEKMAEFYYDRDIDLFKQTFSVPGVSRIMLLKSALDYGASIPLIREIDADLYHTMRDNVTGGLSVIYHRYAEVDKTFVRGDKTQPCKLIRGEDSNSLYPSVYLHEFPTENYIRRHAPHFTVSGSTLRHEQMFHWLNFVSLKSGYHIQHKRNTGSEVRIGKYFVDGFCAETMQVHEFLGCFFHENNCTKCQKADTQVRRDRKKRTLERNAYIEQQGYTIISITDHEFEQWRQSDPELNRFVHSRTPPLFRDNHPFKRFTEAAILDAVRHDKLYGFVEVDIHVPDHLYEKFREMSPLFCTVSVPHSEWGPLMQSVAKEQRMSCKPRTQLVGGMAANKMLLATPVLKWYLKQGLVVTKVYQIVEYVPMRCFAGFARTMTQARRGSDAVVAEICKLLANSSYGSLLLDRSRHCDVVYTESPNKARTIANHPNFKKTEVIGDDLYEIQTLKTKMESDLPVHLGVYLLQMAKLHMLRYHYDVFDRYVPREHYQLLCGDTDSIYYCLSKSTLQEAVRPELLQEFRSELYDYCDDKWNDITQRGSGFLMRECCTRHNAFDKRSLGLMKLEASGDCLVALCSKTYVLRKFKDGCKVSSKGLSKSALQNPVDVYKQVLNTLVTYKQFRGSISYFYIKRTVRGDGVTTDPLKLVLCPRRDMPTQPCDVVGKSHPLYPGNELSLSWGKHKCNNLATLLVALVTTRDPMDRLYEILSKHRSTYQFKPDTILVFPSFAIK